MAEPQHQIDMVAVGTDDILPERQNIWHRFTTAVTYGIGVVAVILIALYLVTG
ncbi:preprotein translocase subunit SecE [Roseomonas elaeocarpi]|uniref:Preprotein translocase subunit SecE n=1 Tax=Roseomonas elaeocarpi TaxID=907779 RepID=A0ABV6JSP7_9PROT